MSCIFEAVLSLVSVGYTENKNLEGLNMLHNIAIRIILDIDSTHINSHWPAGSDSSTAKRSAICVSVTGTRR